MHYLARFFKLPFTPSPLRTLTLTWLPLLCAMIVTPACSRNETLIEVGDRKLSRALFDKRMTHVQLLYPKYDDDEIARGMIEGWAAADVLEQHGVGLGRETLEQERQTIRKDENVRRLYLSAQRIYGQTGEDMLDVGLLPDVAMRELQSRFVKQRLAAERARMRAQQFIEEIREAPERLADKAAEKGLPVNDFTLEPKSGMVRNSEGEPIAPFAQDLEASTEAAQRLGILAESAPDGRLLEVTLRIPRGILVVQRIAKEMDTLHLRAVRFTYDEFGPWLTEETRHTRVCIHDQALRERFMAMGSPVQINCP